MIVLDGTVIYGDNFWKHDEYFKKEDVSSFFIEEGYSWLWCKLFFRGVFFKGCEITHRAVKGHSIDIAIPAHELLGSVIKNCENPKKIMYVVYKYKGNIRVLPIQENEIGFVMGISDVLKTEEVPPKHLMTMLRL